MLPPSSSCPVSPSPTATFTPPSSPHTPSLSHSPHSNSFSSSTPTSGSEKKKRRRGTREPEKHDQEGGEDRKESEKGEQEEKDGEMGGGEELERKEAERLFEELKNSFPLAKIYKEPSLRVSRGRFFFFILFLIFLFQRGKEGEPPKKEVLTASMRLHTLNFSQNDGFLLFILVFFLWFLN